MHRIGHIFDAVFIHTVGGGVGDHQGRQVVPVLGNFGHHIVDVDIAVVFARHHHNLHSRQHSARGIGAVCAGGNQTDGAVSITPGEVIAPNSQKPGVFTLAAGVGLQRNRVIPGQLRKPRLQVGHHDQIPLGVLRGSKRVQRVELGPTDRLHLGGGIEFHRATAQWNHAAIQGVVLVREALDVAHHGRF